MTCRFAPPSLSLAVLALILAAPSQANPALASKAGCLGCHAAATRLVGPAYREVAERYRGDAQALAMLTQRIREGGSGRWGEMAMPPQTKLSQADAKRLAAWILGGAR
jgi:cytochrome c